MKLKLYIFRRRRWAKSNYVTKKHYVTDIHFTVVDAEKQVPYPANFVCVFPKYKTAFSRANNDYRSFKTVFDTNFDLADLALQLLNDALKEYANDSDIKTEISRRIEILTPKPFIHWRKRRMMQYA
jgi:hypothetical protein